MVQIRGCVSSDMGVTFSDVTPMYLYNKQFYRRLRIHQEQRMAEERAVYWAIRNALKSWKSLLMGTLCFSPFIKAASRGGMATL